MQSANPLLPALGFVVDELSPPGQAIVAFFARVSIRPPAIERVALDDACGRVLATPIVADEDYPAAPRSLMDGFAVLARSTPGTLAVGGDVRMGGGARSRIEPSQAYRIPTGGIVPEDADAVVPIEEAMLAGESVAVGTIEAGTNVAERAADMRRGEVVLTAPRRLRAPDVGVLATLGVTQVPVYRQPRIAVFSSGDELIDPGASPRLGEIRDSNRYAVGATLRAMGALPQHYPTLRDEEVDFESAISGALRECDGIVVTGGSSVGERDRLPKAVAAIAKPGVVVHGLRVKPGKPTLFGAHGDKPIIGLPGNPTSALMMLEGVAAPIVAALTGAAVEASTIRAKLAEPARSRANWTWYVPVALRDGGGVPFATPLALRSFSVSLAARADGFIVMEERDEEWPAGTPVTVYRFRS